MQSIGASEQRTPTHDQVASVEFDRRVDRVEAEDVPVVEGIRASEEFLGILAAMKAQTMRSYEPVAVEELDEI